MNRFYVVFFSVFLLISGATRAAADLCQMVGAVRGDQAAISRAVQQANGAPLSAADLDHFRSVLDNAEVLVQFNISHPTLRDAVARYARQTRGVRDALYRGNETAIARLINSDNYRLSITVLSAVGARHCETMVNAQASGTQAENGIMGAIGGMSWRMLGPIIFAVFGALGLGVWIIMRTISVNKARRQRYDCIVPVSIIRRTGHFTTRMIDVSAIGAKFALPDGKTLADVTSISINGTEYPCKRSWENTHYAGVAFSPPLGLRFVRSMAVGRQTAKVAKTVSPVDPKAAAVAPDG